MTDNNDFLSQDELDELLGAINSGQEDEGGESSAGGETSGGSGGGGGSGQGPLTSAEIDMIGEVGNMIMGSASTALFTILGQNVDITTPKVSVIKLSELKDKFDDERVVTTLNFEEAITGLNVFVVDTRTAAIIADLMMGGDGQNAGEEIDDIKMSAVGEAMNQMMGAASTSMSEFLDASVNITPPSSSTFDFSDENAQFPPVANQDDEEIVLVSFDMSIGELASTNIFQILPIQFVKELYAKVSGSSQQEQEQAQPQQPAAQQQQAQPQQQQAQQPAPQQQQQPQQQRQPQQGGGAQMPPKPNKQEPVSAQTVEFEDFDDTAYTQIPKQLELLYDVPLEITVELGRSKLSLKEVMDLNIGSIIELDKLTGEHVDILVNGKVIAKGEVVVVSESFGVRVTEIVNPKQRIGSIQ